MSRIEVVVIVDVIVVVAADSEVVDSVVVIEECFKLVVQTGCSYELNKIFYLVQLIEHPILRIPNFNFPNLRCCKVVFSF